MNTTLKNSEERHLLMEIRRALQRVAHDDSPKAMRQALVEINTAVGAESSINEGCPIDDELWISYPHGVA